jgi:hypothetical protein
MWPIVVASAGGGYFARLAAVNPGKGGRNPFASACRTVDIAGENRAAWKNATRSAGVQDG